MLFTFLGKTLLRKISVNKESQLWIWTWFFFSELGKMRGLSWWAGHPLLTAHFQNGLHVKGINLYWSKTMIGEKFSFAIFVSHFNTRTHPAAICVALPFKIIPMLVIIHDSSWLENDFRSVIFADDILIFISSARKIKIFRSRRER